MALTPTPVFIYLVKYLCLNVYKLSEEKCGYSNGSFYDELLQVFHNLPNYHIKILLGNSNAKLETKVIFKPTIGNKSPH